MIYEKPGSDGALFTFRQRYENFVGGEWVAPADGVYFENRSPVDGKPFCEVARSSQADLEKALDAAHAAAPGWGKTAAAERANILLKIADIIDANLETLAYVDSWDNGKAIRETLNADIPLCADHFRYFAGCLRALPLISMQRQYPTTTMNRWALSGRLFRGISRSSWRPGNSGRHWRRAIALFSNRPSRPRFLSWF